jgi:pSer/pThr/pTyr-binding forkhead associated (FHA) protein
VEAWLGPHGSSPAELQERLEAERRATPFLEYRDEGGGQRLLPLGADELTIGRATASGLPLPWDHQVSRTHAALEAIDGTWTVVDDGLSTNGTYVNEERVHGRRRLRHLDVIRVGGTHLRFHDPGEREIVLTEIASAAVAPPLTTAQRRVLEALCSRADGPASNEEIADELHLSVDTVKTHMRALFDAFQLGAAPPYRKRFELARKAVEAGLAGRPDRR